MFKNTMAAIVVIGSITLLALVLQAAHARQGVLAALDRDARICDRLTLLTGKKFENFENCEATRKTRASFEENRVIAIIWLLFKPSLQQTIAEYAAMVDELCREHKAFCTP